MSLYDELKRQKSEGKTLEFAQIRESELMELYRHVSDELIGELYGVSDKDVAAKRKQFGITLRRVALETMLSNPERNRKAKEHMMDLGTSDVALAVSRFLLGAGGEEQRHTPSLETVHKRLTYVLDLIAGEQWQELAFLVDTHHHEDDNAKDVTPDDGGMRQALMNSLLESAASRGRKH